jgi:hypothetical protein
VVTPEAKNYPLTILVEWYYQWQCCLLLCQGDMLLLLLLVQSVWFIKLDWFLFVSWSVSWGCVCLWVSLKTLTTFFVQARRTL